MIWDVKGPPGCRRGDIGIVFLRKFQKRSVTIPLATLMLDYVFRQRNLDAVYGISAVEGRAAIALAKALGFSQTGLLPYYGSWNGKPSSAIMSYLTAVDFYRLHGTASDKSEEARPWFINQ